MPALLARALAVLCFFQCGMASAEAWKKAKPGTSTEGQVLALFGEPTQRRTVEDERVLTYEEDAAPAGTLRADFRVEARNGRLRRIDVYPASAPSRDTVERMFGPACPRAGRAKKPCHEVKLSPLNEPYFHYASRGLAVFFSKGEVRVLTYLAPARGRRALTAELAPPEALEASPTEPSLPKEASVSVAPSHVAVPVEPAAPVPAPAGLTPVAQAPTTGSSDLAVAEIGELPGAAASAMDDELRPARIVDDAGQGAGTGRPGEEVPAGPRPLSEPEDVPASGSASRERTDLLTLGALFFQRAQVDLNRRASDDANAVQPYFPGLVDVYLDFKPQENLRTYVVGRLAYDPLDPELSTPRASVDKLWLYFGVLDRVFVTAGRQHIKWGSSRIWNPTDFLRDPNPDPLGVFDLRSGVDMVKVNIPWESLASNLWLLATADMEDSPTEGTPRLRYGGAVRAEVALGASELIATASFLERRRPRYGLDYSLGVGPLDFNAEVALLRDADLPLWRRSGDGFVRREVEGTQVQASGGVSLRLRLVDLYQAVVRLEGFYNQLGGSDPGLLTWLVSTGDYQPLFFGRYYGLAQLSVTKRSPAIPTVSLTLLGNVDVPSYLGRLDFNFYTKNEVGIAGFVEVPFGPKGGEFRFQPDPSVASVPATDLGLFRAGLSLRFKL
ncbi:hypothetical protein [Pyxidicoccus xibeiensis]|uniref:hypothetical protein n=1 Tax=Pyxidicoccus xibeiensis TaxID=2906759 RepID=UPI0020A7966B|nr:hypothetical protein [Pyxidicoccus xibeiensis]MCP3138671.1 hypothetical protein [Pyxidicoccus xibeiensis]